MKKLLLSFLSLLMVVAYASAADFEKVTNASDLADGDEVVFVFDLSGSYIVSTNSQTTTSSKDLSVSSTVQASLADNISIENPSTFKIVKSGDKYKFQQSDGLSFLFNPSSTTVKIEESDTNTSACCEFGLEKQTNNTFYVRSSIVSGSAGRVLLRYTSSGSTCYRFVPSSQSDSSAPYIYRKSVSFENGPVDARVNFPTVKVMMDLSATIDATYPEELNVTYTSDKPEIISVSGNTLMAHGPVGQSATITAKWPAVDGKYNEGSATFTAEIIEQNLTVTWDFTKNEYGMTRESSTYLAVGTSIDNGITTMTIESGNSRLWTAEKGFRFQSGSTTPVVVGITCPSDFIITEVTVTGTTSLEIKKINDTKWTLTNSKSSTYDVKTIKVVCAPKPVPVPATAVSTVNGLEIEVPENVTGVKYYYGCGTETEEPTEWTEKDNSLMNYHDIIGTVDNAPIVKGDYYIWYYVTAEGYNPSEKQCVKYTHATENKGNVTFSKVDGVAGIGENTWVIVVYNHEGKHYAMGPDGAATQLTVTKSDDKDVVVAYEHQFDGKVTEFQHVAGVLTPKASASAPAAKASRSLGADEHKYENGTLTYGGTTVGFVPADNGEHTFSTSATNGDGLMFFATSDDKNTGVDNVAVDNANAPVEYYNLQGVRVENPAHGLYIKRQGNTAVKVSIK